jgi:16S rRNA (guanine527-N7)-methyltransferase
MGRPYHGRADRRRAPLPTRVDRLPHLPARYDAALDDGLREIGLALRDTVRRALADHVRLLLAWTAAINLTAIRDPAAVARLHVIDSLTGLPVLRAEGARRVLDLGSGGGFPGLPLALALPADRALLVDSVAKKVRFLEAAIEVTGAAGTVEAVGARAEQLARDPARPEPWDAVTVRAVASLPRLVDLAFPLLRPGGCLVAWKRAVPDAGRGPGRGSALDAEIAAARPSVAGAGGGRIEIVDPGVTALPGHLLVVVRRARPRSPATLP